MLYLRNSHFILYLGLIQTTKTGNHSDMTEKMLTGTYIINANKKQGNVLMILLKLHMHKIILKVHFRSHSVSLDVKHFVRTLLCTILEKTMMILEIVPVKLTWA